MPSKPSMTRAEAIAIRAASLQGRKVKALELQEAVYTLSKRRDKRVALPKLSTAVRETANAVLLFNLGLAIGRVAT